MSQSTLIFKAFFDKKKPFKGKKVFFIEKQLKWVEDKKQSHQSLILH